MVRAVLVRCARDLGVFYGCTLVWIKSLRAVNSTLPQAQVEFVGGQQDRKFAITHLLWQEAHVEALRTTMVKLI